MELHSLKTFLTVASEKSFSRAAQKLLRTQPAISLSIQRLEAEMGEPLIDRLSKHITLTPAGQIVYTFAQRFESLQGDLENALAELRDKSAGRLAIGANESSTVYLLDHLEKFRAKFPKIRIQVRRSQSSRIPSSLIDGELELGILTYDPEDERIVSKIIYNDHLAFVVSPKHALGKRKEVSIEELGGETFIAHNVTSPYRGQVIRAFAEHKIPLKMDLEMPTIEAIRKMVERNEGVSFLPRMCVEDEIRIGLLNEIKVKELAFERQIRLVYPARRALSHAAQAFLEVVAIS